MVTDVVILAAGKGKRMKSDVPKPLHKLLGKPMVQFVIDAAKPLVDNLPVLVIGHQGELFQELLEGKVRFTQQKELLGTGHAVSMAEEVLKGKSDLILVMYGDMPLIRTGTLEKLLAAQSSHSGPMTLLTLQEENPRGFGRIIRNGKGEIQAIVEEAEATLDQLQITELNAGMYCFKSDWLWDSLNQIELSPKGEYYLTDLVALAAEQGHHIQSVLVEDREELIGINTRIHLAESSKILQRRINRNWMLSGVTFVDPERTYIEPDVTIGKDTEIYPNTYLVGNTKVGSKCLIGPDTKIVDSQIGDSCEIEFSVVEESRVEDGVDIGPFSHLRQGSHLGVGVHIGNFGEIKESFLGEGTKVGHFSYIGNAQIGKEVNIGAGTITCNYDGEKKHQTTISDGAFIGSDSMLVAPLKIGKNAVTGAGSVVTKDVPPDTVVAGVPARQISHKKKKQ